MDSTCQRWSAPQVVAKPLPQEPSASPQLSFTSAQVSPSPAAQQSLAAGVQLVVSDVQASPAALQLISTAQGPAV